MNSKNLTGSAIAEDEGNLIYLESDIRRKTQTNDINSQIGNLEDNLSKLQSSLIEINQSVESGLDRLSDSDLDLAAKVSDTYRRLGEVDNSYKSLAAISEEISGEVKSLADEVNDVAKESAAELADLSEKTSIDTALIDTKQRNLVQRIDKLVDSSQKVHLELTQSIENNAKALNKVGSELEEEIKTLASSTELRDSEIESNLTLAEQTIERQQARLLQMQSVDRALERRADSLDETTQKLTAKSAVLKQEIAQLAQRSSNLSTVLGRLQLESEQHEVQIKRIKSNAKGLYLSIKALTRSERRHFQWLTVTLAFVIVFSLIGVDYQQTKNSDAAIERGGLTQNIEQQNIRTQGKITESAQALMQSDRQLENRLLELDTKMVQIKDSIESLDGRMNYISPNSQFGKDSTIHGAQWIKAQKSNSLTIHIATAINKNELYSIAQRYSHYFNGELSYYSVRRGETVYHSLIYGIFTNDGDASAVFRKLPYYISQQRPSIVMVGEIQHLI